MKNINVRLVYIIYSNHIFGDNILPKEFVSKIEVLIKNEKFNKIKFKLMDINERR